MAEDDLPISDVPLTDPGKLPDLPPGELSLSWDRYWTQAPDPMDPGRDDYEYRVNVLMHDERVIWRERTGGQTEAQWVDRIDDLLRQRYGSRYRGLERGHYAGIRRSGFPYD